MSTDITFSPMGQEFIAKHCLSNTAFDMYCRLIFKCDKFQQIYIFVVVVVVVLLFYVHGKHLRSCRDGQLS